MIGSPKRGRHKGAGELLGPARGDVHAAGGDARALGEPLFPPADSPGRSACRLSAPKSRSRKVLLAARAIPVPAPGSGLGASGCSNYGACAARPPRAGNTPGEEPSAPRPPAPGTGIAEPRALRSREAARRACSPPSRRVWAGDGRPFFRAGGGRPPRLGSQEAALNSWPRGKAGAYEETNEGASRLRLRDSGGRKPAGWLGHFSPHPLSEA